MNGSSRLNRMYRRKELPRITGLGLTQTDELIKSGEFPEGFLLSDKGRAKAWLEDDLIAWQQARAATRNNKVA